MALTKLTLIAALAVASASANINITSPIVTNSGPWGPFHRCPWGRYAQGFQLKTEPNQYLGDDTALNALRLFCGDPFRPDTAVITSTQGDFGDWGNVYTCFPGELTGFQLRSESNRGSGDDTAANNIRFYCSTNPNQYIEGDGMSWGDWTEPQRCYSNQAICAIQTQVEPKGATSDDTMVNNVRFECCDKVNAAVQKPSSDTIQEEKIVTVGDLKIFPTSQVVFCPKFEQAVKAAEAMQ